MSIFTLSFGSPSNDPKAPPDLGESIHFAEDAEIIVKLAAPYGADHATIQFEPNITEFNTDFMMTQGEQKNVTLTLVSNPTATVKTDTGMVSITLRSVSGAVPFCRYEIEVN